MKTLHISIFERNLYNEFVMYYMLKIYCNSSQIEQQWPNQFGINNVIADITKHYSRSERKPTECHNLLHLIKQDTVKTTNVQHVHQSGAAAKWHEQSC